MNISKVFVVGAGFMGSGIVENAASKGLYVTAYDISEKQLEKSLNGISSSLQKSVAKGKLSEQEAKDAIARITTTTDISDCKEADVIIEAVAENKDIKVSIMKDLEKYAREDAIVASNTSSISITALAHVFSRPERFVGMHFFSPVPKMPLMEIVTGYKTGDDTLAKARELGEFMGKSCIISHDEPGFIVNRMLIPMLNLSLIHI